MKVLPTLLLVLFTFTTMSVFGQGGKAEPNRIKFAAGSSSAAVTGRLSNGVEMEYVFGAMKGQTVTIKKMLLATCSISACLTKSSILKQSLRVRRASPLKYLKPEITFSLFAKNRSGRPERHDFH